SNAIRLTLAALLATAVLVGVVVVLVRQMEREQRHAAALRRSEERLHFAQFALDHAADMVFWADRDAQILYANAAASDRLGYRPDEIATLSIAQIDPEFTPAMWTDLLSELSQSRSKRFETTHRTRDGATYPAEVSVNYVEFNGAGYVCGFVRDITERRRAEAALAEKTASLEASNAELEQFAYVASHDLREPLRMVNSFVTLLARRFADKLDDEGREYIGFAQEGAVRMDRLILDLLEYSRVGRLDRPFAPLPLARAAEVAVKALGVAADEAGATIEIAPDLPEVLGNEEELVRLYQNLVGNALKYRHLDRPAKVSLGAEWRGGELMCWVADNGIGIAPQYYERVFRIFQRLHGRDRYDGTGIGLAICKKIVERHGGRIWVESVPDQGSTFFFTLKGA
ncbi:MAG TPA: ATP-binding protein, partial [Candidatus Omnitrophota bacterium]|nr:ATP-binding protein [Candidatus Omnitrophota bacterium]